VLARHLTHTTFQQPAFFCLLFLQPSCWQIVLTACRDGLQVLVVWCDAAVMAVFVDPRLCSQHHLVEQRSCSAHCLTSCALACCSDHFLLLWVWWEAARAWWLVSRCNLLSCGQVCFGDSNTGLWQLSSVSWCGLLLRSDGLTVCSRAVGCLEDHCSLARWWVGHK
jgi:hypothetical protein